MTFPILLIITIILLIFDIIYTRRMEKRAKEYIDELRKYLGRVHKERENRT